MPVCFVIQPFDGGRFDKRYKDVFEPAIRAAGLEPYRVDSDPSASIPIDQIERAIRTCAVCFADITVDNPNVWFELGFALASEKPLCLVCADERTGKYPFDVQHRQILKYGTESPSDFENAQEAIKQRLGAIQDSERRLAVLNAGSAVTDGGELAQHELTVLATIVENRDGPRDRVSHWVVKNAMEALGFNNIGVNIGIERLLRRDMISVHSEEGQDDAYSVYAITDSGINWLLDNYKHFDLGRSRKRPARQAPSSWDVGDEIPF